MGQYWRPVNLDKREFVNPHKLDCGAKLCEQLSTSPGTGAALIVLCANQVKPRGGGDLDMTENWHGPERAPGSFDPAPMPAEYAAVARRTIGRWAGDRVVIIGCGAEDGDLPGIDTQDIYRLCAEGYWADVSDDVRAVIEHELRPRGQFGAPSFPPARRTDGPARSERGGNETMIELKLMKRKVMKLTSPGPAC